MLQLDSHPALLIIDMQNAFCHDGGSFAKLGIQTSPTSLIPHINLLRKTFHLANLPVIFLITAYNPDYSDRRLRSRGDRLESFQGLIRGSWDAEILHELQPQGSEVVLEKTRYSGFLLRTELEKFLNERKVNHLVLTGVGTDVCVETTAREAYQRDFAVTTVRDGCGACTDEDHRAALRALRLFGGTASTVDVVGAVEALRESRG